MKPSIMFLMDFLIHLNMCMAGPAHLDINKVAMNKQMGVMAAARGQLRPLRAPLGA